MRNSSVGVITHIVNAALSFVARTIFIRVLGVEYLGISGLFSNILTMLALSDLGIYTVMTYSLYKPIAKDDKPMIAALIHYFQRLYNIVGIAVLCIGVSLIPFLPKLVNDTSLTFYELSKYYIILLLNSVVSYFAISRSTLFRADQKVYIVRIISTISTFAMHIAQIVLLIAFKNFTIYLASQVIFTLGSNIAMSVLATKKYPYLAEPVDTNLTRGMTKEIIHNLKASFIYKIGSKIMNSTDNILISVLISTTVVGYYSNYVTVFSLVNTFVMIIIEAVLASVGNFIATESADRKFGLFKLMLFVLYFTAAFCVSCYLAGMNDFIGIWLGENFIINGGFIIALALNRFVFCIIHPLWMMRESSGIFISTQYVMLFASAINIVLSVILGKMLGITGIILATALANLLTVYWYEPIQLSKKVFNNKVIEYWRYVARLLCATVPSIVVGLFLLSYETRNFFILLTKFLFCGLITLVSFILAMHKTDEYHVLKLQIMNMLKKNARG